MKAEKLDIGNSTQVSSKHYISWNQFIEYFTNYSKNKKTSNVDLEFRRDEVDDQNMIEVPKPLLAELKNVFKKMKNKEEYVKTCEYLDTLKQNDTVKTFSETAVRSEATYGSIPAETLSEVI